MKISTFIITYNEGDIIERCLEKLTWCDEIVIVDSGSTDNTISICEYYGARIYHRDFDGFGDQKQFALSCCTNEWVLNLDADEILTDSLIAEIQEVAEMDFYKETYSGCYINMRMVFLGKIFHYGNESNRKIMRFFKKSKSKYTTDLVHEKVLVEGQTCQLKNYYLHYSYQSLDDFDKLNKYTSLAAENAFIKGKKYSVFKIVFKPIFQFIKKYFINLNIANGKAGLYWSILSAYYDFIKSIKTGLVHDKKNNR